MSLAHERPFAYTYPAWYAGGTQRVSTYTQRKRQDWQKAIDRGTLAVQREDKLSLKQLCKKIQHEADVEAHQTRRYWLTPLHTLSSAYDKVQPDTDAILVYTSYVVKSCVGNWPYAQDDYYRYSDKSQSRYTLCTRVPLKDFWPWSLGKVQIEPSL